MISVTDGIGEQRVERTEAVDLAHELVEQPVGTIGVGERSFVAQQARRGARASASRPARRARTADPRAAARTTARRTATSAASEPGRSARSSCRVPARSRDTEPFEQGARRARERVGQARDQDARVDDARDRGAHRHRGEHRHAEHVGDFARTERATRLFDDHDPRRRRAPGRRPRPAAARGSTAGSRRPRSRRPRRARATRGRRRDRSRRRPRRPRRAARPRAPRPPHRSPSRSALPARAASTRPGADLDREPAERVGRRFRPDRQPVAHARARLVETARRAARAPRPGRRRGRPGGRRASPASTMAHAAATTEVPEPPFGDQNDNKHCEPPRARRPAMTQRARGTRPRESAGEGT